VSDQKYNGDPLGLGNLEMTQVLIKTALAMIGYFVDEGDWDKAQEKLVTAQNLIQWMKDYSEGQEGGEP
jgi:hypothetical protein